MPQLRKVFISHSHKDEPLASALRDMLREVFTSVEVAYSSDKEAGGGVASGSNWLDWIHTRMRDCQESLLLLTPYSIRQPWPMWEAGAVGGMGLIADPASQEQQKLVTPIRFNIAEEALPGPFQVTQAIDGRNPEKLGKLLGDLMRRHDYANVPLTAVAPIVERQVPKLLERITAWLENAPPSVTEGMISEWCDRIDKFRLERRSAEVRHLHRWIKLMYEGPSSGEADSKEWGATYRRRPWDLRLHLRLAENYSIARQSHEAIEQYTLAVELAPLDVFVLHRLAQVYLDVKDSARARQAIDQILKLDPEALKWNAEVAGLEGRYWKDEGRKLEGDGKTRQMEEAYRKALSAYQAAMELGNNSVDYYMADNVGQLSLLLGDLESAKRAYTRVQAALDSTTPENESIWTLATRVNAGLVLGDEASALKYLTQIGTLKPTESQQRSIVRGLELVAKGLGKPENDLRAWSTLVQRL